MPLLETDQPNPRPGLPGSVTCPCGAALTYSGRGRPPIYCSPACKKRHYRATGRDDRAAESARRRQRRRRGTDEPLPHLYEHLRHGRAVSFWDDELRMDLAQEAFLAQLEGRDILEATRQYRNQEIAWRAVTIPFLLDGIDRDD